MSSLAQEESRSISENITWGQHRSFESGKVHLPYGRFLGYKKGEDGKPEIDTEQTVVVELIYRLFLDGKTPAAICKYLENKKIPAPGGGEKWTKTTITSILSNEKYKGHALLQKTFTTDFLEKTKKINEGEVPQYYVEDSHPAIIDPDIWHSTDKYRCEIWQCNAKFKNDTHCCTPTLTTEEIQRLFIEAYNKVMTDVPRIVADCKSMQGLLTDTTELDRQIEEKTQESELLANMVRELIHQNASAAQSQDDYQKQEETLYAKFDVLLKEIQSLKEERERRLQKERSMSLHIRTLKRSRQVLTEWDDTVWTVMIEKAIVHKDKTITFIFNNGKEIRVGK